MSEIVCEKEFKKDYVVAGERLSPPEEHFVDGVLLVSNGRYVEALPILHWVADKGEKVFLCQGLNRPGKAPAFSVAEKSLESLIQKIRDKLR
jgi:hypothetical protein